MNRAELTEITRQLSARFAWQEFRRMDDMVAFLRDPWAFIHAMAEERQADHHGPHDRPHDVVREAAEHLLNGRITSAPARKQLRDALDKADRAPTGPDWGRITSR